MIDLHMVVAISFATGLLLGGLIAMLVYEKDSFRRRR